MSFADPPSTDMNYSAALASVHHAIAQFDGCTPEEKDALFRELRELEAMAAKLESGRVEIVLFGEIDTGKSALINALVGQSIAQVDVRGGWTRDVWHVNWDGSGYVLPGLAGSHVVLIDTPGINEVEGADRARMAREAAARADLILFVTDSDLNQLEYSALVELAGSHKPILLILNKADNYTPEARQTLLDNFALRLRGIVAPEDMIETTADPLPREYVIEAVDGSTKSEYRRPLPNIGLLKERILEILASEGKAIVALNGALYAADKSDRITTIKMQMRDERATATIWSYAAMKAVAVAITPVPVADVLGGSAVDATMVVTLAHVYGIRLTSANAQQLIVSIAKAAGWVTLMEMATHAAAYLFVGLTLGAGKVLTAVPQGAAAGYGSLIVGQAAKYYFEHGASWGDEAPKTVVTRILAATDKQSVLERLQAEIRRKISGNRHSGQTA
jgi:small GTP-binding protein